MRLVSVPTGDRLNKKKGLQDLIESIDNQATLTALFLVCMYAHVIQSKNCHQLREMEINGNGAVFTISY